LSAIILRLWASSRGISCGLIAGNSLALAGLLFGDPTINGAFEALALESVDVHRSDNSSPT